MHLYFSIYYFIFSISLISNFFYTLFGLIYACSRCSSGNWKNDVVGAVIFFRVIAEACFILHILLMCKGWGIFKYKLKVKDRIIITIYIISYIILAFNSLYWKEFNLSLYDNSNVYVLTPGIIYLIVRLSSFLMMNMNLYHSIPNNNLFDNKFLLIVYMFGLLYIISPCIGLLISLSGEEYEVYIIIYL